MVTEANPITDWTGKRVTVMGLGRFGGGVGVTRWLARGGARVLATDEAPAEKLQPALRDIADLPVELRLGCHDERDFRDTDLVVVNPAVRESSPFLAAATAAGVPITTEINLFVERCRGVTVGVTGSVGKSTTTAMIGHVLERTLRGRRVWVGGNIGRSLLDTLPEIGRDDPVVLELSSFQLARTPAARWSPRVGVLTNLEPNHLDWHPSYADYVSAKLNLFAFQDAPRDHAIVGRGAEGDPRVAAFLAQRPATWRFVVDDRTPIATRPSALADGDRREWPDAKLRVPGRHNLENAAAALLVSELLGIEADAAIAALASFAGLPHRLQRVVERDGVTYFNDSKSTTPESAITALNAVDLRPLLVILGGYDKHVDLRGAAQVAAQRAAFAACIGQTGPMLREAISAAGGDAEFFASLEDAVRACRRRATRGGAVLLSPACASWDMFEDYRARGEQFVQLVTQP
ncbi:MAG: UDP-N-acetylmuramoyl-L-alanine--D-glutamate ligase [Phycisphaerae bacterium]